MAITILIELALFLRLMFWRKHTPINTLVALILLALAIFQTMEYGICEGLFGIHPNVLARIGFVAITTLPVIGLHLIQLLGRSKQHRITIAAYSTMALWIVIFLFSDALVDQICGGNYMIFKMSPGFGGSYFVYYYFWLLVGSVWALNMAKVSRVKKVRASLRWMVIGYASFTVPATLIWLLDEQAAAGLPSIMCGFAIIFAVILFTKVLPNHK